MKKILSHFARVLYFSISINALAYAAPHENMMPPGMGGSPFGPDMGMAGAGAQSQNPFDIVNALPPDIQAAAAQEGQRMILDAYEKGGDAGVQALIDNMKAQMPPEILKQMEAEMGGALTPDAMLQMARQPITPAAPPQTMAPPQPFTPQPMPQPINRPPSTPRIADDKEKSTPKAVTSAEKQAIRRTLAALKKHLDALRLKCSVDQTVAGAFFADMQNINDLSYFVTLFATEQRYEELLAQPTAKKLWALLKKLNDVLVIHEPRLTVKLPDPLEDFTNPYTVLGVSSSASDKDIDAAFKKEKIALQKNIADLKKRGATKEDVRRQERINKHTLEQKQAAYDQLRNKISRKQFDATNAAQKQQDGYAGGVISSSLERIKMQLERALYQQGIIELCEEFLKKYDPIALSKKKSADESQKQQKAQQERFSRQRPAYAPFYNGSHIQLPRAYDVPYGHGAGGPSPMYNPAYDPYNQYSPHGYGQPQGAGTGTSSGAEKKDQPDKKKAASEKEQEEQSLPDSRLIEQIISNLTTTFNTATRQIEENPGIIELMDIIGSYKND